MDLYYLFLLAISHNSEKNKTVQIIGLCFNIMNEMCVIWKKVKVWLTKCQVGVSLFHTIY